MTERTLAFVGTITRNTPFFEPARGTGIKTFAFDEETGALELIAETGGIDNPSYFAVDPKGLRLYAASEVFEWNEGTVTALRIEPETAGLVYLNKQPTLGNLSCHIALDRSRKNILATHYTMRDSEALPGKSFAVLPLVDGGMLGPATSAVTVENGSGPVADRQERSHPHSLAEGPDGLVAAADLGTDRVYFFRLNAETGKLGDSGIPLLVMPPGSGPRHVAWSRDGERLYVINELASTVAVIARRGSSAFEVIQIVSTLPVGIDAENRSAGIKISADGRFLFGSNRGHDSIAAFAIDPSDGTLQPNGHHPSGGKTPRTFDLDPSGRFLVVANQDGHNLTVLRIDSATGALSDSGVRVETGSPMCVDIVRVRSA